MKTGIVIVAGGTGTRMGAEIPKQFLPLVGRPLLMHTIERFAGALPEAERAIVLPAEWIARWAALCEEHGFEVAHTAVAGGTNRFESVRNALAALGDCDCIGVHDGVRPIVSAELIRRVREEALRSGAAIPVVPLADSLREVVFRGESRNSGGARGSKPVDRSRLRAVQTPQFFRASLLRSAYEQDYSPAFTDDASVVEAAGHPVTLVEGDPANLKITTPIDLAVAETLLGRLI
jgi:2-C-methyl-D-erythritol 4-phosphate cytidylyltransferase